MHRPVVLAAAIILVVAGCGDDGSPRDGARTYYESLDDSHPPHTDHPGCFTCIDF